MSSTTTSARRTYDQACPVAHALDVVGERWTLLIVRDLLFGPLRFTDLRRGLPGLAPNLLSDRLRWLVGQGLVEQIELVPPAARTVYALTPRGRALGPVVHALARFGVADWPDPDDQPPPRRLLRGALLALMEPERLGPDAWSAVVRLGEDSIGLTVAPPASATAPLDRLRLVDPLPPDWPEPDVEVTTTLATLVELARGERALGQARRSGHLRTRGPAGPKAQLAALFGWR